ncbi:thiamine pyrophosphate-binding protein [Enterobacter hormaechei]|uniref:thiamine pyrophosphate-binding protein n=1 Tax=Enterobacter hormaechei TaxID=158836 RepID=UPI003CC62427
MRAQGVETVFGYPGGAIMPITMHCMTAAGTPVCRHEQGAAMAAIGYARATVKPASVWPPPVRAQRT